MEEIIVPLEKKFQNAPQSAIILDVSRSNLGILVKYEV